MSIFLFFAILCFIDICKFCNGYEFIHDKLHLDLLRVKRDIILVNNKKRSLRTDFDNVVQFDAYNYKFDIELQDIIKNDELFTNDFSSLVIDANGNIESVPVEKNCIFKEKVKNFEGEFKNDVTISFCHGYIIGTIYAFDDEFLINLNLHLFQVRIMIKSQLFQDDET